MRRFFKVLVIGLTGLLCLIVGAIVWPLADAPVPARGTSHVIANVRVVDVVSGTASALQSVRIDNGVIAAIGKDVGRPGGQVIDAQGGYLIPGLWDMHSHSFQLSPQLHFPLQIANGVTGVRDMMGCPGQTDTLIACEGDKRTWNDAAVRGQMVSPRFIGMASYLFDDPAMLPDEAAQRVVQYAAQGAGYVKIYDKVSRPAYDRIAKVAQQTGTRMVGHLPKSVSLDEAIDAGQSSFEHARLFLQQCHADADRWRAGALDAQPPVTLMHDLVERHDGAECDRLFGRMAAAKVAFVPTHVTREEDARATDPAFLNDDRLAYADPLSRWAWKDDAASTATRYPGAAGRDALHAAFAKGLALTGQAHAAGVRVLVGTDTIIGGFKMHDEMGLLVRAGMTPAAVLRAATLDAATHVGQDKAFGSIAVGKQADVVILRQNPLDDIAHTRTIDAVFVAGHHYDTRHLARLRAFTRAQAQSPANWLKMIWGFVRTSVSL